MKTGWLEAEFIRTRDILQYYLTDVGRTMILAAFMAGLLTIPIPAYHIFTVMVVALAASFLIGLVFWPHVEVGGRLPAKIVAGQTATIKYTLKNRSRLPAYDLNLGLYCLPKQFQEIKPNRHISCLRPGESVEFSIHVLPLKRGQYHLLEPRCLSTFPFNLFRNGGYRVVKTPVLVLPAFTVLDRFDISADMRYQPGGITMASRVGESPEYIGNREYQFGDSPRRIDSRAWARLTRPVVKEYSEEYYCHVAVVMDTFIGKRRKPGPMGYPDFEAAVSVSAAMVANLSRTERIIDFFAAGTDLYVFRAGRHIGQFDSLLEILANVEPNYKGLFDSIPAAMEAELEQTSAVIFVLLDWDETRENLVRRAVVSDCSVKVIIIREKQTSRPFREALSWAGEIIKVSPENVQEGHFVEIRE